MAVVESEEPIVTRLDRLDHMLRHLEELKGCSRGSPRTSCASTPSSGTLTSDGRNSSIDFSSPKSLEKYCRPIESVVMETEIKGTLIDRLNQVEDRLLKLCTQQLEEEEIEMKRKKMMNEEEMEEKNKSSAEKKHEHHHKKGLKQLVKSCVRAGSHHKSSSPSNKQKKSWKF